MDILNIPKNIHSVMNETKDTINTTKRKAKIFGIIIIILLILILILNIIILLKLTRKF